MPRHSRPPTEAAPPRRRESPPVGVRVPSAISDARERLAVNPAGLSRRTDPTVLPAEPVAASLLDLAPPILRRTLRDWLGTPSPAEHLLLVVPDDVSFDAALVEALTPELAGRRPAPDVVYASPGADLARVPLLLAAGTGDRFVQAVRTLLDGVGERLAAALGDAPAEQALTELGQGEEAGQRTALETLERAARKAGYTIRSAGDGLQAVPILHGKPLSTEQMEALDGASRKAIEESEERLNAAVSRTTAAVRSLAAAADEARGSALSSLAVAEVAAAVNEALGAWIPAGASSAVAVWIELVRAELGARWAEILSAASEDADPEPVAELKQRLLPSLFVTRPAGPPPLVRARDVSDAVLFGGVVDPSGRPWPGLVHEAAGGVLLLDLADAMENPDRWRRLRGMLRTGVLAPEGAGPPIPGAPADARVVMIARGSAAEALEEDVDVSLLLRVRVDVEATVPRTPESVRAFDGVVAGLARTHGWGRLDVEARALTLDLGARLAGRQDELPLGLVPLEEVLAFAAGDAAREGTGTITAAHVRRAWDARVDRVGAVERRVRALTGAGEVRVETSGSRTGVANGLAVLEHAGVAFGHPVRITAVASLGRDGIVDVERESELGGAIHTKGVAILRGYLSRRFGQLRPLSLRAQLVVEQSYGGIEGDSASAAELFALLSELADVPLDQGIAITGSVNQLGEIQAIGGVVPKIEGFFEVCAERGLTGRQGVLLPRVNLPHVVLRDDVAAAIADGRFRLWLMDDVVDGIAVLTGLEAGARDDQGHFPAASVFGRVERRLIELAERLRASESVTSFEDVPER